MDSARWDRVLAAERLSGATTVKLEHTPWEEPPATRGGYWSTTVDIARTEEFMDDGRWTHATFFTLRQGELPW